MGSLQAKHRMGHTMDGHAPGSPVGVGGRLGPWLSLVT